MKTRSKWTQRMRSLFSTSHNRTANSDFPGARRRLAVEPLEDRHMLSVLFVDADAAEGGDGRSWQTAYRDLQSAFDSAETLGADTNADNDIDQIWIAEGTYLPTAPLEPSNPRSATFSLPHGVTLYGGFDGTETSLNDRDTASHETILSGDLGAAGEVEDNAYTVVYCFEDIEAGLDGVTVTGGYAFAEPEVTLMGRNVGGGIYSYGTLTLVDSLIAENNADSSGAGVYNHGTLNVLRTRIQQNGRLNSERTNGSGIRNTGGTLTITDSVIAENGVFDSPNSRGGAICSFWGTITVTNSIIARNAAGWICGGHIRR